MLLLLLCIINDIKSVVRKLYQTVDVKQNYYFQRTVEFRVSTEKTQSRHCANPNISYRPIARRDNCTMLLTQKKRVTSVTDLLAHNIFPLKKGRKLVCTHAAVCVCAREPAYRLLGALVNSFEDVNNYVSCRPTLKMNWLSLILIT